MESLHSVLVLDAYNSADAIRSTLAPLQEKARTSGKVLPVTAAPRMPELIDELPALADASVQPVMAIARALIAGDSTNPVRVWCVSENAYTSDSINLAAYPLLGFRQRFC
ncbi:MAG: hypothetical protein R3F38_00470 [Gammaproteobacteria bacterium]